MQHGEVLVIVFRRIEAMQGLKLGHDRPRKGVRLVELGDIGVGNPFLFIVGIKDRRAILRTGVRSLPIELGRVVRDRKINLQILPYEICRGSNVTATDSAWPVRPPPTIS